MLDGVFPWKTLRTAFPSSGVALGEAQFPQLMSVATTKGSVRLTCPPRGPRDPSQDALPHQKQDARLGTLRGDQVRKCFFLLQGQLNDLERCGPSACASTVTSPLVRTPRLSSLRSANLHGPRGLQGRPWQMMLSAGKQVHLASWIRH